MRLTLSVLAATAAVLIIPSLGAAPAVAAMGPIQVQQCFVTVPKPLSHNASGTQIVYVNHGRWAATSVTFAVGYRNAAGRHLRRVTDVGQFSPGDVINHHFSLFNDLTYAGKQTTGCRAVEVRFANGSRWRM